MPWYLVIRQNTQPGPGAIERHLRWLRGEHDRGVILISGPDPDRTMSLFVLRAPSSAAAEAVVRGDPLDRDGQAPLNVIEWEVHQMLGIGFPGPGHSAARGGDSEE